MCGMGLDFRYSIIHGLSTMEIEEVILNYQTNNICCFYRVRTQFKRGKSTGECNHVIAVGNVKWIVMDTDATCK